jgi:hypothetical protein
MNCFVNRFVSIGRKPHAKIIAMYHMPLLHIMTMPNSNCKNITEL